MTPPVFDTTKAHPKASDALFIYYIEGVIHPATPVDHPDFLGNWVEDASTFLFFGSPADEVVKYLIQKAPHLTLIDRYDMTYDQWQGGDAEPFTAGPLTIRPFRKGSPPAGRPGPDEIFLDAGVVFGNGAHPTTSCCLSLLADMGPALSGKTVQDLGTGTGLLALGAARLGAKRILAVDLNHLAVRTTHENACINGLSGHILSIQGRAEEIVHAPADLVVANIHYDIMKHLVVSEGFLSKNEAILSGLLTTEAGKIETQLVSQGFRVAAHHAEDGIWHTFHVKRG
ncbi:50S ribosomal protein L11 methyltransferase [Desulfoluna spongiiphila]|uniref:Ribosomal protein L11 methyltransferase n=1 Tax=Desulfoluna spongiiphila TaxID=419481 RepID=A0A1G5INN1_9BACT|nr:50S ribosomal protein L11 methyltransferase [Desulfoluna spongiiphila]SCY77735.1 ribosomal protein L11 methyltransferase [Desulfoluna spongiiphila]